MLAGHNKGKYFMPGKGYVRGKKSERQRVSGKIIAHECPFCRHYNLREDENKSCGGCGRYWFRRQTGSIVYVGYIGDGK